MAVDFGRRKSHGDEMSVGAAAASFYSSGCGLFGDAKFFAILLAVHGSHY